ncbi:MAG: thioredoxin family protein [Halobacteriales archaeon]
MVAKDSETYLRDGDPIPPFELTGTDGERHALLDVETDLALVVFTCNHCPYAKAKHPLLNRVADEYDEVTVIGINPNDEEAYPDDSYERMVEEVETGTIDYDWYLRDHSQDVVRAYQAVCTPDPFLAERADGRFELRYQGRLDDALNPDDEADEVYITQAIDALLAGESVDLAWAPSRGCSIKYRENPPIPA